MRRLVFLGTRQEVGLWESVLDEPERRWMLRLMSYYQLPHVRLHLVPQAVSWLGSATIDGTPPKMWVSQDFPRFERSYRRLIISHETTHLAGYDHLRTDTGLVFATHLQLDTLTPAIERDIQAGTAHFDPQKFGMPMVRRKPPTEATVDRDRVHPPGVLLRPQRRRR